MEQIIEIRTTKFSESWRTAELHELKTGLEYIHVNMDALTSSELKRIDFHIYKIEAYMDMFPFKRNRILHKYTQYKDNIKKWTKEKRIYILDIKDKPVKKSIKAKSGLFD